ncbi:MAG: mechanosensitive ion channel family protein [Nitrospiraceae bacterium]|nr:mechanosensitive ion channel family protein [Nitrospiraceae bacterium]
MYEDIKKMLTPVLVCTISITVLLVLRKLGFGFFHKWAEKTETKLDNLMIESFKIPTIYIVFAIGIYIGITSSDLSQKYMSQITKIIYIIIIFAVTIISANLAGKLFRNYIQKSNLPVPTTGLAYGILKGTIIAIGILIILSFLGISITPIITALGVGGLAVALALQDTLANLFAGIHILVEKSIRIGDFIKLDNGQEGYVEDITWRTTRIRMIQNNMIVIPNNKLSQSIVTNYHLPEKRSALSIVIPVSYSSDIDKVEKIILEETNEAVFETQIILDNPQPFVRLIPGFGESSLDFTLTVSVREFADQQSAQHELRKRIFKRFKKEGIEIPFPHRIVYMKHGQDTGQ